MCFFSFSKFLYNADSSDAYCTNHQYPYPNCLQQSGAPRKNLELQFHYQTNSLLKLESTVLDISVTALDEFQHENQTSGVTGPDNRISRLDGVVHKVLEFPIVFMCIRIHRIHTSMSRLSMLLDQVEICACVKPVHVFHAKRHQSSSFCIADALCTCQHYKLHGNQPTKDLKECNSIVIKADSCV